VHAVVIQAYFALDIIFVLIVYGLQNVLVQLHLKGWADWTSKRLAPRGQVHIRFKD